MRYTREGRAVTYVHYGDTAFDPVKFTPAKNDGTWVKPKGGLWASPDEDSENSWKYWCDCNEFRECSEDNAFRFNMRDPSRIFFIDSKAAYDEFVRLYVTRGNNPFRFDDSFSTSWDSIDFEKMASDGYDGMEISLSSYPQLYNLLYCWDVDSIVVFNRDAVVPC